MVNNSLLEGIPVAICANKQDLPNAMDTVTLKEHFNRVLEHVGANAAQIFGVSALKGAGVSEAFAWTCSHATKNAVNRPAHKYCP